MGALFSSGSSVDVSDIKMDFKNDEVLDAERELYDQVQTLLDEGKAVLDQLERYQDCGPSIRKALSNPSQENEREAFGMVKANVDIINGFYQFSKRAEKLFPQMLKNLAKDDEKSSIQQYQATSHRIADVLDFVLKFDELKMLRPGLQNDFSYYRRSLGKHMQDKDLTVRDDEASFISLFIAQPIPMMTAVARATTELMNESPQFHSHVPKVLATISNVCLHVVKKGDQEAAMNLMCVRAMVGSIVLFDHVSAEGAFVKRSGINVRQAVQLLVKEYSDQQALLNAIRYSAPHFSDDSTPSAITNMLKTN